MTSAEDIMIEPPADGETIDPAAWFDLAGPFELEIGCGKGGFLLSRARTHPEVRLLGIEWANKYYRLCADRMARWNVHNVRVMRTDAKHFVCHHLPPACLAALHVYHPDPWPKKRHHKRRLVDERFAEAASRALVVGARWWLQSDHQEYFEIIRAVLDHRADLTETAWGDESRAGPDWDGTNFEIKYEREGRAIYRVVYEKTAPA